MLSLRRFPLLLCWVTLLVNTSNAVADAEIARQLFAENRSAILQIRLIDLTSGSKSAIGSGFAIDHTGLIATNYHVIQLSCQRARSVPD